MSRSAGVWPIEYSHYVPGDSLRSEMMRGCYKIVMECGGIKKDENVIISCDMNKLRIAECLAGAVLAAGAVPTIIMIPPTGAHGRQLPPPATQAFSKCDVFFLPATYSQTHTDARIIAMANGARGCTLCEVTEDLFCTGAIMGDFELCDMRGRKVGAVLAKAKNIRYMTKDGTNLSADVEGRPVQYETGLFRNPGDFASVPNSEVNIAPIEGTANGTIVANVRVMNIGVVKDEPITIHVKDGLVTGCDGSAAANEFWDILCGYGDGTAFNIAEFGFGLNDLGRIYANNLEALGRFGVGHIGIGSNYAIGGKVKAPCHLDVSFLGLEMYLDGKLVYDQNGIYV